MSEEVETALRALVESGRLTREQAAWCWDEGPRRGVSPLELARRAAAGAPDTPPAPFRVTPSPPMSPPMSPLPSQPLSPAPGITPHTPARTPGLTPGRRGAVALPEPGDQIADYRIERKLGAGGMGAVFLARDSSGEPVALKILTGLGESGRARFRRELEAIVAVDRHPHIVRVLAADAEGSLPWLALEYVAGESLDARLERDGPIPSVELWPLAAKVCEALEFLHSKGLLHRDLKPANVLLREDGRPMLADFGLAWREDAEALTRTGELVGTPAYMAPEAFEGKESRGVALDIWGMGVLLFECATGRRPFEADSGVELVARICSTSPPAPGRLNPALELAADALILRCLERDPARRPESAGALAKDLERLASGERLESTSGTALGSALGRLELLRRRTGAGRLIAVGALLLILGLGAWLGQAGLRRRARLQRRRAAREALDGAESAIAAGLPELRAAADRALSQLLLAALAGDPASTGDESSKALERLKPLAPLRRLDELEAAWRKDSATRPLILLAHDRAPIREARVEAALLGRGEDSDDDAATQELAARALRSAIARIPSEPEAAEAELRRQLIDARRGEVAALGLAVLGMRAKRLDAARRDLPKSGSSAPLQKLRRRLVIELGIQRWTMSLTDRNTSEGSLVRLLDGLLSSEAFGDRPAAERRAIVQRAVLRRCEELRSGPDLGELERHLLRRLLALNDSFIWLRPPDWPPALLKSYAEDLQRARDYGPAQILRALACRAEPKLEREFFFRVRDWQLIEMLEPALRDKTYSSRQAVRWVSIAAGLELVLPLGPSLLQLIEPEIAEVLEQRQRERPQDPRRAFWVRMAKAATLRRAVKDLAKSDYRKSTETMKRVSDEVIKLANTAPPAPIEGMPNAYPGLLAHWEGKALCQLSENTKSEELSEAGRVRLELARELGSPDKAELFNDLSEINPSNEQRLKLNRQARRLAEQLIQGYESGATQQRPGVWPLRQTVGDIHGTFCAAHEREAFLLVEMGQLDEAERLVKVALELRPRQLNMRSILGRIALARGDLKQARRIADGLYENSDGDEDGTPYSRDFMRRVKEAEAKQPRAPR